MPGNYWGEDMKTRVLAGCSASGFFSWPCGFVWAGAAAFSETTFSLTSDSASRAQRHKWNRPPCSELHDGRLASHIPCDVL